MKKGRIALFLLIFFFAAVFMLFLTTSPMSNELCVVCHSMKSFKASIEKSEHGKFNCHTCHQMNSRVIKDIIVYIYKNPTPEEIKKRADVNIFFQCLSCHRVNSKLHSEHSEEKIARNMCHYIHEARAVEDTMQRMP